MGVRPSHADSDGAPASVSMLEIDAGHHHFDWICPENSKGILNKPFKYNNLCNGAISADLSHGRRGIKRPQARFDPLEAPH